MLEAIEAIFAVLFGAGQHKTPDPNKFQGDGEEWGGFEWHLNGEKGNN